MYGALTSLIVQLPAWNDAPLSNEQISAIAISVANLNQRLEGAPKKLVTLGKYLSARVKLEQNNYAAAAKEFEELLSYYDGLNCLAWYGKSVLALSGPEAAMDAISKSKHSTGYEIDDLRKDTTVHIAMSIRNVINCLT